MMYGWLLINTMILFCLIDLFSSRNILSLMNAYYVGVIIFLTSFPYEAVVKKQISIADENSVISNDRLKIDQTAAFIYLVVSFTLLFVLGWLTYAR